jgi:DNA-binding transcriptional regulator LsrR (DeoR family)
LADALGLTAIHVNRVLRQLRERGLVSWESQQLTIHDLSGLAALAHFDGSYLDHNPKPK